MVRNHSGSKPLSKRLYKFSLQFLVPLTRQETYPIIGRAALKLLDAKYASLFIKDEKSFERVWDSSRKMFRVKADMRGYAASAVKSRTPTAVGVSKLALLHPNIVDWGVKTVIFIPLFYKDIKLGYIALDSFKNINLTGKQKDGLKIFGSMATLAVRKAQLHDQLEESLQMRDLFISLASHELRTPLTTINSYSDLIHKTAVRKRKVNSKWTKILRDEVVRLILMVNELLEIEQIKKGQLQYHWKEVSVNRILERSVLGFKARYPSYDILYQNNIADGSDKIVADFDKLMEAVSNLLDNAAKFSKKGTQIQLSLDYAFPNFIVKVRDFGSGIAKGDLPRIFEGFYKGGQRHKEGLGIGLFLTKSIVEMHRGKINISSKEGNGTLVELILPAFLDK